MNHEGTLVHLAHWVAEEAKDKLSPADAARFSDARSWDKLYPRRKKGVATIAEDEGVPAQRNGYDCGVFLLAIACCVSRKAQFAFSQGDMPRIRKAILRNIIKREWLELS
jgi:hypothetical protein